MMHLLARVFGALLALSVAFPGSTHAATRYVWTNSPSPGSGHLSWDTAAHTIQDAVDVAGSNDTILVTNGVYDAGERVVYGYMKNRVAITAPITVQSVNGPSVTIVRGTRHPGTTNGESAVRCAYVTNGAVLVGFTLTNGATRTYGDPYRERSGGGAWCEPGGVLSNCTLGGNSADAWGGGSFHGTLDNCVLVGNSAGTGGGAYTGSLYNCSFSFNSSRDGGGAYGCRLEDCVLTSNTASFNGGGACISELYRSMLVGNVASNSGGGTFLGRQYYCTFIGNSSPTGGAVMAALLVRCTLSDNAATRGGGVCMGNVNNCALSGNSASESGGGAYGGRLYNSAVSGNSAQDSGAGAYGAELQNCTLTGNSASNFGGGTYSCTTYNCILWNNEAPSGPNWWSGVADFSCTDPLPPGTNSFSQDPLLASASHLSAGSPCIGRGGSAYTWLVDIDGEPWADPPSIGCDEYWAGSVTGALGVAIQHNHTNFGTGIVVRFAARIEGRTLGSVWDFGDGYAATNQPYISHAWPTAGTYTVTLTSFNETFPEGVSTTVRVVSVAEQYVSLSGDHVPPFASWATAATTIQAAVDTLVPGVSRIVVNNGLYNSGGRALSFDVTNRVTLDRPVTVCSANGPAVTVIEGQGPMGDTAVRCAYVGANAVLSGFTLTNGYTRGTGSVPKSRSGGGVSCATGGVISNCVLSGNSAGVYGGGAYQGTLYNCTLMGNSVSEFGGGACLSTLYDCTLSGNTAYYGGGGACAAFLFRCVLSSNSASGNGYGWGGGTYEGWLFNCTLDGNTANGSGGGAYRAMLYNCTLHGNLASNGGGSGYGTNYNCILWNNIAPTGANWFAGASRYSCTTPLPDGTGNITSAPVFIDASAADFRQQPDSPCINAGANDSWMNGAMDLAGNPRIFGQGRVDMGAYEYQSSLSVIPTNWLAQFGLPLDGTADFKDPDVDGFKTAEEYAADTDPTNAASRLAIVDFEPDPQGMRIAWQGGVWAWQYLQCASEFGPTGAEWQTLFTNAPPTPIAADFIAGGEENSHAIYRIRAVREP